MSTACAKKLRQAMHENMSCIGHFDGGLEWITRDAFVAYVDEAVTVPDPAPWHVINAISVTGDVATVQLEDIWLGQHCDDTLTLLFYENQWVIVSKVFYLRPQG